MSEQRAQDIPIYASRTQLRQLALQAKIYGEQRHMKRNNYSSNKYLFIILFIQDIEFFNFVRLFVFLLFLNLLTSEKGISIAKHILELALLKPQV